jgi:transposase-like protein
MTLKELLEQFPNEDSCKRYLMEKRWPDGVTCPKCGNKKVFHVTHRPFHWVCKAKDCGGRNGYRFSVISRTVFQDTKRPLREWFTVAYLMLNAKKGISSLNVQRIMGFKKEKTAWYMCHRVRAAMHDEDFRQLMGIVEIDETYIGGKQANRHAKDRAKYTGRGASNTGKTTVIGAISRKGNVVCKIIEDTSHQTINRFVHKAISDKVDLVATDSAAAYSWIGLRRKHESVDHKAGEYVRGIVHTNNIESFWALLKRAVIGTYHNVSRKYLPLYLAEFQFRRNHRNNPDLFGEIIAGC